MGQGINFMEAIERKSLSHKSVQTFTILREAVFLFVTNAVLIPWVKWPMQALFPIDKGPCPWRPSTFLRDFTSDFASWQKSMEPALILPLSCLSHIGGANSLAEE